jgi:hypothetical protein
MEKVKEKIMEVGTYNEWNTENDVKERYENSYFYIQPST